MRARLRAAGLALAFASVVWTGRADALTVTTTFNVTANVQVSCRILATELAFATYDAATPTPSDAQSNVLVICTSGAAWELALDKGLHGTSVTTRAMANQAAPSVLLNYVLFSDPARTINWGETIGTDTVTGTGTGTVQAIGVYGRVPAHQTTASAGGYSDTITATLTF